jgi:hypothetical protein
LDKLRDTETGEPADLADGHPLIAFGPAMPGWGSWEWIGTDLQRTVSGTYRTATYGGGVPADCAAVVLVKFAPAVEELGERSAVVYCPVDRYGSAAEIEADRRLLRRCARVVVHCERLRRYFAPYAPVEYLDHHVKFAAPLRETYVSDGPLIWVGVRSNLPPLVEWVNAHPLPGELWVLTNLEAPGRVPRPSELGFRRRRGVRVENWSPDKQREWTGLARAALDVKGDDFRSRHKPPAKAIDFIASGVPLALNPDSSPAEHLGRLGFDVPSPLDADRWLARDYWEETRRFGAALRELLSLERIARRFRRIIDDVLAERRS